jgi:hypothetical protein
VENCAAAVVFGGTRIGPARSVYGDGWKVRSNPTIRTFYLRLRANGQHTEPALIACLRKFLVILNAIS